jgi:hypothetical protein
VDFYPSSVTRITVGVPLIIIFSSMSVSDQKGSGEYETNSAVRVVCLTVNLVFDKREC